MPKRKKRLLKGIESLKKQIEIHRKKLETAKESGDIGLAEYYEKEIEALAAAVEKRRNILEKK